jgi:hypothetical protein
MMGYMAGHGLVFTGMVQEPQQCLGLCDRRTTKSKVFLLETKINNPKSTHCALIYDRSLFMNVTTETLRVWSKICEGTEIYGISICQVGMRFTDTKEK